jgi:hypothetical protein
VHLAGHSAGVVTAPCRPQCESGGHADSDLPHGQVCGNGGMLMTCPSRPHGQVCGGARTDELPQHTTWSSACHKTCSGSPAGRNSSMRAWCAMLWWFTNNTGCPHSANHVGVPIAHRRECCTPCLSRTVYCCVNLDGKQVDGPMCVVCHLNP